MNFNIPTEEQIAIDELKAMSLEELEKVPFDVARWQCKVKLCHCYTRVRDYGIGPVYYHKSGVTSIEDKTASHWIDTNQQFFVCSKHSKRYKHKTSNEIPLKRSKSGGIIWGYDETGKELIIY